MPPSAKDGALFGRVVADLRIVRAGAAGVLTLDEPREPSEHDPLFAPASEWVSRTPYRPTRHPSRSADPETAAVRDLSAECLRRGLPRPSIEIRRIDICPRGGISAEVRIGFAVGVAGPLLLGRDAHRGGGLFAGER